MGVSPWKTRTWTPAAVRVENSGLHHDWSVITTLTTTRRRAAAASAATMVGSLISSL